MRPSHCPNTNPPRMPVTSPGMGATTTCRAWMKMKMMGAAAPHSTSLSLMNWLSWKRRWRKRYTGASVHTSQTQYAHTATVTTTPSAHRARVVRVDPPSRPAISREDRGIRIEAAEPAVAWPPARQDGTASRQPRQRHEPSGRRALADPLRHAEDAVGVAIPLYENPVALEALGDTEPPLEDLPDDASAFDAEVERGTDALGGEGQALSRRVAYREEAPHGGTEEAIREVGAVVRRADRAAVAQEALEGGLELGESHVGTEADQAALAHGKYPAEPARNQPAVEPKGKPVVGEIRLRLEAEGKVSFSGRGGRAIVDEGPAPSRAVHDDGRGEPPVARAHRAILQPRHRGAEKARPRLLEQPLAESPVVESAERYGGQIVGDAARGGAYGELVVDLQHAIGHAERLRNPEGRAAGRGLHGADFMPVEEEDSTRETASHGEAGKAGAHDDGVVVPAGHVGGIVH